MSLQNVLKANNYDLHCNSILVNNIDSDAITVNNINSLDDPQNNITIAGNLVVVSDDAYNLGAPGKGFESLYCRGLNGLNGPVNVVTGIRGNNGTNPLVIYETGLQFLTNPVSTQSVLNNYYSSYSPLQVSGFFSGGPLPIQIAATVIGNSVTFGIGYFNGAGGLPSTITISLASLPGLIPVNTQSFVLPMLFNGSRAIVSGQVDATGITIYSDLNNGTYNNSMNPVGLAIPVGGYYNITYQLD